MPGRRICLPLEMHYQAPVVRMDRGGRYVFSAK